nr:hypothetical protein [Tanacetum cinerariifolium]
MERFDVNRASLEPKHGPRVPSVTLPLLPLVALCGIVVFLLSLSQYSNLQSWSVYNCLILLPQVVLIFPVSSKLVCKDWKAEMEQAEFYRPQKSAKKVQSLVILSQSQVTEYRGVATYTGV